MTDSLRSVSAQLLETQQELEATKQEFSDFRQKVSDAVCAAIKDLNMKPSVQWALTAFIIPAPKPDPLVEALADVDGDYLNAISNEAYAKALRAALEARGLEIRSKSDD